MVVILGLIAAIFISQIGTLSAEMLRAPSAEGASRQELLSQLKSTGLEELQPLSLEEIEVWLKSPGLSAVVIRLERERSLSSPLGWQIYSDMDKTSAEPDEDVSEEGRRSIVRLIRAGQRRKASFKERALALSGVAYRVLTAREAHYAAQRLGERELVRKLGRGEDLASADPDRFLFDNKRTAQDQIKIHGRFGIDELVMHPSVGAHQAPDLLGERTPLTMTVVEEALTEILPDVQRFLEEKLKSLGDIGYRYAEGGKVLSSEWQNPSEDYPLKESDKATREKNKDMTRCARLGDFYILTQEPDSPEKGWFALIAMEGLLNRIPPAYRAQLDPRPVMAAAFRRHDVLPWAYPSQSGRRTINLAAIGKQLIIKYHAALYAMHCAQQYASQDSKHYQERYRDEYSRRVTEYYSRCVVMDDEGEGGGKEALELVSKHGIGFLVGPPVYGSTMGDVVQSGIQGPPAHNRLLAMLTAQQEDRPVRALTDHELATVAAGLPGFRSLVALNLIRAQYPADAAAFQTQYVSPEGGLEERLMAHRKMAILSGEALGYFSGLATAVEWKRQPLPLVLVAQDERQEGRLRDLLPHLGLEPDQVQIVDASTRSGDIDQILSVIRQSYSAQGYDTQIIRSTEQMATFFQIPETAQSMFVQWLSRQKDEFFASLT